MSIDISLLTEYADTPEDIQNFVELFINQSDESVEEMSNYCVDGESNEWVGAAHKFKGGAGMVGAKKLHVFCSEAQEMEDVPAEERKKKLEDIKAEYQLVRNDLSNIVSS